MNDCMLDPTVWKMEVLSHEWVIFHRKNMQGTKSVCTLLQSNRIIALIIVSLFLLWFLQQSDGRLGLLENTPQSKFCSVCVFQGKMSEIALIDWLPAVDLPGDQTELCGNCLLSHWRLQSEGPTQTPAPPVWQFGLRGLRRAWWPLWMYTGADAAGRHPGSAAAGHSSHFISFHHSVCPWWHQQGHLIKSAKLVWHWKVAV